MKIELKYITHFFLILGFISISKAQTTIYTESFESDQFNINYVMNRFTDGGQDYFGVTDALGNTLFVGANSLNPFANPMTSLNGTNCVAAEDLKRTDNPLNTTSDEYRGYFITKTLDVSTYANVQVKLLIGCRDPGAFGTHEAADNDAFRIQYAFDTDIATGANNTSPGLTNESTVNTGNYTDIGRFLPNNQFGTGTGAMQEDTNLDGSPNGALLGNTLVEYEYTIPVTGTNLSVRIHMDYDDSAEEMAFDFIRLIGSGTATISPVPDIASLPNLTAQCEITSLTAPTADGGTITGTHTTSLPITSNTTITWTYTNGTGEMTTQMQNVVIDDTIAPVANAGSLADVTAQCEVTSLDTPTATDNCDDTINGTHNATFPITSNTAVTWTYTDSSGNSSLQNQNVVINDTIAPLADAGSLADVTAQCEVTSLSTPTATDNCDNAINGTHNATFPITSNTTVTWTYTDTTGNASTQNQNVVINDSIAPVADTGSLSNVTEECEVTSLTTPTATDNCDNTINGTHNATFPITSNTMVTWTYTDSSGNSSSQMQNVVIDDTIAPVADNGSLANIAEECEVTSLTIPTATDNCDGTINGTSDTTFPINTTTIVTWTYIDSSGNSSTQTQEVIINDTIVPEITCQDITVQLDSNGNASITASDILPLAVNTYTVDQTGTFNPIDISTSGTDVSLSDDEVSSFLPIGFSFDFYGNTYTDFRISSNGFITFNDDINSGCCDGQLLPNSASPNNLIALAWEDLDPGNGGQPIMNVIRYETFGVAPNRILIVEYFNVEHFPSSNNVTTQAQLYEGTNVIEIHTTNMPSDSGVHTQGVENIDGTAAVTTPGRNSNGSWSLVNDFVSFNPLESVNPSDNCGIASVSLDTTDFTCTDIGTNTVTVTVTDTNGNTAMCTSTVTIEDVLAPVADTGSLAEFTAQCEITSLTAPTATDNCDGVINGTHNATFPINSNTTVTWTYTDSSGNFSSQMQNVVIDDTIAPVADNGSLADVTAQCEVTSLTIPTATDNCDNAINGTHDATLPINSTTTVTWTYTDSSGNSSQQTQEVIIDDTIAPIADNGSLTDITAECEVTSLTIPTATDNCDNAINGTNDATLPINSTTTVTWTYTDSSGNSSQQTQEVIINDTISPIADSGSLADITAQCEVTSLTIPTATDNCDNAINGTHDATLPINATTTVTWTYTDSSGNSSQQTQEVIIDDTIAPIADSGSLADINAQCEVTSLTIPTATDNCDNAINGTHDATLPIISNVTVTWTYMDLSGNSSQQTQEVIINDTIAPIADTSSLADVTAQCEVTSLTIPTATDNCDNAINGTHDATFPINASTTVTWTYTDLSGNSSLQTQEVIIDDTIAPIADSGSLADVTAQCEVTSLTIPTATDNCDNAINGTHDATFPINASTTVTWTYTDLSGNSSLQTQEVIINDTIAPIADSGSLADITAQCEVTSLTIPTATDNCDNAINGTHNATFPINASTTVTWTYTDSSGNSSTQDQEVIIDDTIAPIADSGSLVDITAECEVTSLTVPTATDNCDNAINGTHDITLPINASTTVTWTYTDSSGNSSLQTQEVIIDDTIAPIADSGSLVDITTECEVTSLTIPTATDNCDGAINGTNNVTFPINSSTTVTWTFTDSSGNSSSQDQEIIIINIDNTVTQTGEFLSANATGTYTYQWFTCNNGNQVIIDGATDQTYTAIINGDYSVEISNGICAVISDCITVNTIGTSDNDFGPSLKLYPNPTNGNITIDFGNTYQNINISIRNVLGQLIDVIKYNDATNTINYQLRGASGTYFIHIESQNGKSADFKIFKN